MNVIGAIKKVFCGRAKINPGRERFLRYQLRWIHDKSRLKIAEKSRQIGWTWATAYGLVRRKSLAGATGDAWISSRDELQARLFLEVLPPDAGFSAIYMLFPDPWPKKRHHKYRLLQTEFLHDVAQRAGQGTPLFFRTDHLPYFTEAEMLLRDHPDWRSLGDQPWPFELATVFQQKAPSFQSLVAVRR